MGPGQTQRHVPGVANREHTVGEHVRDIDGDFVADRGGKLDPQFLPHDEGRDVLNEILEASLRSDRVRVEVVLFGGQRHGKQELNPGRLTGVQG